LTRVRQGYDDRQEAQAAVAAETLRSCAESSAEVAEPRRADDRISVFWRVFGGTLLSIVALGCVTVYTQLTGSLSDLRRDVNHLSEARADLVKKEEFNSRLSSVWGGLKELQTSSKELHAGSERTKLLEQQLERQMKTADEERREMLRKLEEQRKAIEDERKDIARRMEEQRKAVEDERREVCRKVEEQRRTFDDERKDLHNRIQGLTERLSKLEGRHGKTASKTASPPKTAAPKN
jgi:DNA repair exonuclease SbcCD ATPase subunit